MFSQSPLFKNSPIGAIFGVRLRSSGLRISQALQKHIPDTLTPGPVSCYTVISKRGIHNT